MDHVRLKIFSQIIALTSDKPAHVETIASSQKEQAQRVKGHIFLVDEQELINKISKKLCIPLDQEDQAYQYLKMAQLVSFQFQIYPTHYLQENCRQRLLQISLGLQSILEIALVSHNRLLIQHGDEKISKKAHLTLHQWNSLTVNYSRISGELQLYVNQNLRASIKPESTTLTVRDLLKCQFVFGGHSESLPNDKMTIKNQFKGLIKSFQVSLNCLEEVKSTKFQKQPPQIVENSDEFVFLHCLYELAKFDPERYTYHKATVPLAHRPPRNRKVMICHDIPGGLQEERFTQGLYQGSRVQEIQENWYRFTQWNYIDVFIYFGHYTLTIPPTSYINIAHSFGVKMLGTLIFEWEEGGKEAQLMIDGKVALSHDIKFRKDAPDGNRFYAKKLALVAKTFGFDGYLMNFECDIQDTQMLIEWLGFLRAELHREIPGSLLVWYDSVLHDGSLRWQSALNDKNYKFFQVSDAFFTDYHWGLENLQVTLDTFKKQIEGDESRLSTYDIYIGNDIYGRGTYGGGQLQTHVAIQEILKYPFSISLFGQAFWYENLEGKHSSQIFKVNEDLFWKGRQLKLIGDSSGKRLSEDTPTNLAMVKRDWNILDVVNGGWKVEKEPNCQQFVSIASFQLCQKYLRVSVAELTQHSIIQSREELAQIVFICRVRGTGPDYKDMYKISVSLLDQNNFEIHKQVNEPGKEISLCNENGSWTPIKIIVSLNQEQRTKVSSIQVMEEGKDVEYWAGHFGTQFAGERLYIESGGESTLENPRDLLSIFKSQPLTFESVSTFFNIGHGTDYYIDGDKVATGNYANLNEYDLFLMKTVNGSLFSSKGNPFYFEITQEGPHFVGGSCLQIKGSLEQEDFVTIFLQDLVFKPRDDSKVINTEETVFDIKVAFKLDFASFSGVISLVFGIQQGLSQEIELITKNTLYLKNGWAVFEAQGQKLEQPFNSIGFKITHSSKKDVDLRVGMVALVPSQPIDQSPQQLTMSLTDEPITIESIKSLTQNTQIVDVHLAWQVQPHDALKHLKYFRIFRNAAFIGTVSILKLLDKEVEVKEEGLVGPVAYNVWLAASKEMENIGPTFKSQRLTNNETPHCFEGLNLSLSLLIYRIEAISLKEEVLGSVEVAPL